MFEMRPNRCRAYVKLDSDLRSAQALRDERRDFVFPARYDVQSPRHSPQAQAASPPMIVLARHTPTTYRNNFQVGIVAKSIAPSPC
jgi:hypothetical protein